MHSDKIIASFDVKIIIIVDNLLASVANRFQVNH